ncbi:unnamed protein product, partial [Rotaria sp. Silwood2]
TREYDNLVVPLLRRMSHLEELTLYLNILGGPIFIDGNHLDNRILIHMPQLHTFTYYISTENAITDPVIHPSNADIQRTFKNANHGKVSYITNNFPNMLFNTVTYLMVRDKVGFKHEFFVRLARSFPFVKHLSVSNIRSPFLKFDERHLINDDWSSIVKYAHLISLDIENVNSHYIEHFLNETKTHLPCLIQLKIRYNLLEIVTQNFTRDATRCNCAKVKRLIVKDSIVYSKDVYRYFPSLSI